MHHHVKENIIALPIPLLFPVNFRYNPSLHCFHVSFVYFSFYFFFGF